MLQLLQSATSGRARIQEVPAPRPAAGQILVRTAASVVSPGTEGATVSFARKGLLGKARARPELARQVVRKARNEGVLSAVAAARARLDRPLALGYAAAGKVLEVGPGVDDLRVGSRVACAGAGYAVHAQILAVPENLAAPVPEGVSDEEAAFATLGAIALHGFRLSGVELGETVAVIGLGVVGLLAAQIARAAGCRVLGVDLDPARVSLARTLDIDEAVVGGKGGEEVVSLARALTGGMGVDAVLVAAATPGNEPVELAGELCRDRGRVVVVGDVGMEVPRTLYYEKELDLRVSRSYGPGRYDPVYEESGVDYPVGYVRWTEGRNLSAFLELVADGRVRIPPLISHRFPIQEGTRAYELLTGDSEEPFLGIVLTYPDEAGSKTTPTTERIELGPVEATKGDRLAVGLLGAGSFANKVLLPILRKDGNTILQGVCAASGSSARHAGDKFGFAYCTTDDARVLDDPEIDAVVVVTRHHLHARQVAKALEAGKHVFTEKPLCLNREELRRILRAHGSSEGAGRLLMVGYNRRFSPMGRELQEFFAGVAEPLVARYRVNAGFIPLDHWIQDPERGGGRIVGEVCHFVDFLVALTGALPVSVQAQGLPNLGRYRNDNLVVTLELSDGSVGSITYVATGDEALGKERCEVFGGGRAAVLDDYRTLELVSDGRTKRSRSWLRQDKGHDAEWQAFRKVLLEGGPGPIPLEELVAVSLTTFAVQEALEEKSPVAVDAPGFMKEVQEAAE